MGLYLVTDYRDYYDHAFDTHGTPFHRLSKGGMGRREMFPYLESIGLKTPRYGIVAEVVPNLLSERDSDIKTLASGQPVDLVVYTDEQAHCGDGKVRVSGADALRLYPDQFCSEHLTTSPSGAGLSLRYLQVGSRKWWLQYWSSDDWRSNVGEGGVEVLREEDPPGYHPKVHDPLFAVDFLPIASNLFAIDFNIAPGLGPLRDILAPSEIVSLLGTAIERERSADTSINERSCP